MGYSTFSKEELDKRTYTFPTSQIKLGNEKSSYYEVISSKYFEECSIQARWLMKVIDFSKIDALIDDVPLISKEENAPD